MVATGFTSKQHALRVLPIFDELKIGLISHPYCQTIETVKGEVPIVFNIPIDVDVMAHLY